MIGGLACLGLILVVDGAIADSLDRYRYAAYVLGAMLFLPLAVVGIFRRRGFSFLKFAGFACIPVLALLVLAEVALHIFGTPFLSLQLIEDSRLGHRMLPANGEADRMGFRNTSVPQTVHAVFLGDSQVYGVGVTSSESIPAQFAESSGLVTQNLALIGYGPVQYYELTRRALEFEPDLLVIGFYLGNDLFDAYSYAHLPIAAPFREPGRDYPVHRVIDLAAKKSPNLAFAMIDFAQNHSHLFELAWTQIKHSGLYSETLARIYQEEPSAPMHRSDGISTLFTPMYRLGTMDSQSTEVREGIRITRNCIEAIAGTAAAAGVPVMMLMIHTKEYCYQELYRRRDEALPALSALHSAEQQASRDLLALAEHSGIQYVEPIDDIVAALADGQALWRKNSDGHPNAVGYGVLARSAWQAWQGHPKEGGR